MKNENNNTLNTATVNGLQVWAVTEEGCDLLKDVAFALHEADLWADYAWEMAWGGYWEDGMYRNPEEAHAYDMEDLHETGADLMVSMGLALGWLTQIDPVWESNLETPEYWGF